MAHTSAFIPTQPNRIAQPTSTSYPHTANFSDSTNYYEVTAQRGWPVGTASDEVVEACTIIRRCPGLMHAGAGMARRITS
jgi:hypothetical protein